MISSRNLSQRLKKLEVCVMPAGNPLVIKIVFVSSDGERTPGPIFEAQSAAVRQKGLGGGSDDRDSYR